MRRLAARSALLLWIALCLPPACGGMVETRASKLLMAVRNYNDAIRWQAHTLAVRFIPPDQRASWLNTRARIEAGGQLKITEYQIVGVQAPDDGEIGYAIVELSWVRMPDLTVRTERYVQTWTLERSGWHMTGEEVVAKPGATAPPSAPPTGSISQPPPLTR